MRILFTNDDGYNSEGLLAVADLFKADNEIAVVAPDNQRSGASHSITLKPNVFTCRKIVGYGYDVYAVGATPVDCVKIAISELFKSPDIVISGINRGENLGSDVMYSGTVSAAFDAAHLGLRAIALSLDNTSPTLSEYQACARFIKDNFDTLSKMPLPSKTILNINFPSGTPRGVKIVKMNTQETFIDRYVQIGEDTYMPQGHRDFSTLDTDTDEWYCHNGYITITPIAIDRTEHSVIKNMRDTAFKL